MLLKTVHVSEMHDLDNANLIKIRCTIHKLSRFENIKTAFMGAAILNN